MKTVAKDMCTPKIKLEVDELNEIKISRAKSVSNFTKNKQKDNIVTLVPIKKIMKVNSSDSSCCKNDLILQHSLSLRRKSVSFKESDKVREKMKKARQNSFLSKRMERNRRRKVK